MTFAPPPLPPAGWYPDPERPGGPYRWWNGTTWDRVWQTPTPPRPASDLPDIGGWLSRAFSNMWRRWRALLTIGLLTAAPSTIATLVALRYLFDGVLIVDEEVEGWDFDRLWVTIAIVAVAALVGGIATLAANLLMLDDHDVRASPSTSADESRAALQTLGRSLAALPRAIAWMLVVVLGIAGAVFALAVVFIVAWPLGLLVTLGCIPLGFWLIIRWSFVLQAIVDGPGNPFTRSAQVSARRFWPVCGRVLLMWVIAWAMSAGGNTVVTLGGGGAFGNTFTERVEDGREVFDLGAALGPSIWSIALSAVVATASTVFVTGTIAAAFAELYRTRNPA